MTDREDVIAQRTCATCEHAQTVKRKDDSDTGFLNCAFLPAHAWRSPRGLCYFIPSEWQPKSST